MSKYKGQHGGKKGQKIRAGVSPPPLRAMPERKHFFSGGLPLITSVSKVKFYTNVPWLSCTCEWNMACDEKIQALGCVWPQILPKPSSWNPFAHIQHHLLHIHPKCCVSASNLAFQLQGRAWALLKEWLWLLGWMCWVTLDFWNVSVLCWINVDHHPSTERESHEKRKIKCEFSHQRFQPHQRWANYSVFKYY